MENRKFKRLSPKDKKRIMKLVEQGVGFIDRLEKIRKQSTRFYKRTLAYRMVESVPEEKVKELKRKYDETKNQA